MKAAAILTDSGHIGWTNNSRRVPTKCYEVSNCWAWRSKGKSPNHKRLRSAPDWVKSDYTQILGSTSPTQLYVTAHNLTHSQTRTLSRLGIKRLLDSLLSPVDLYLASQANVLEEEEGICLETVSVMRYSSLTCRLESHHHHHYHLLTQCHSV